MAKKIDSTSGREAFLRCISELFTVSEGAVTSSRLTLDQAKLIGQSPSEASFNQLPRNIIATAVRWSLQLLEAAAPGRAVEVRVPPFGAVQVMEGTTHRRGTPPAVIEMNPTIWLGLASGAFKWEDALSSGAVLASGNRANLSALLPLEI